MLTLDFPWRVPFDEVGVAGQGLVLIPSCFVRRAVCAVSEGVLPAITYPARGRATAWVSATKAAPDALVGILGKVRSQLLVRLATPATTGDLATSFGVTSSAISQHLSALHAARLVNRSREGRCVLYFRSPLGDNLVGA